MLKEEDKEYNRCLHGLLVCTWQWYQRVCAGFCIIGLFRLLQTSTVHTQGELPDQDNVFHMGANWKDLQVKPMCLGSSVKWWMPAGRVDWPWRDCHLCWHGAWYTIPTDQCLWNVYKGVTCTGGWSVDRIEHMKNVWGNKWALSALLFFVTCLHASIRIAGCSKSVLNINGVVWDNPMFEFETLPSWSGWCTPQVLEVWWQSIWKSHIQYCFHSLNNIITW